MVTNQHEIGHTLFEDDPGLISRALRHAGLDFPDIVKVEQLSTDLSNVKPVERRADRVMRFVTADGREAIAIVEMQRTEKGDKPADWAHFGMVLVQRHNLPVVVLVITDTAACERWAGQCFDFGLGFGDRLAVRPLVLGPSNVRVVADVNEAIADPIYAALSVIVHRDRREIGAIIEAVGAALPAMPEDTRPLIYDYVELILGKSPLGDLWRNEMALHPDVFQGPTIRGMIDKALAEGKAKGKAEGKAEGEAKFLLTAIKMRGIELTEAQGERVRACADEQQLEQWLSRVFDAASAADIFGS